jgi:plastocyanin
MDNQTLFYVCGVALALSAVALSFIGLKAKNFPGRAFPAVLLWFAILVGGATTFSVLHAKDEEHHKEAELEHAGQEFEAVENQAAARTEASTGSEKKPAEEKGGAATPAAKGPGETLQLSADPAAIAYDKTELAGKSGKVTIDFTNPAPLEHDVAIEGEDGKEIAASETIAEGETSVGAELAPGTYAFYCTVPGHREAGMEGKLTVR